MEFATSPLPFANCTNITEQNLKNIALARGITGLVCFIFCLITLITELVLACQRRQFRTILHRLFIYLTISTSAYLAVLSLHIEHYFEYRLQHNFCIAIGFLDEYTGSVQLCFTFGITTFLFYKVFTVCQDCIRPLPCEGNWCYSLSLEVIFVILSVLAPLGFDWIPPLTPSNPTHILTLSPGAPIFPCGPFRPVNPLGPRTPFAPGGPCGPFSPFGPGTPGNPG